MTDASGEVLVTSLALIGIVIIVSALLSGLIDRSGLPQVAVFLAIGAALGPAGLNVFNLTLDSPALRVVATLSLTLVLFTDAVTLNTSEVKRHSGLAFRMLGPGTVLCAAITAVAAWWLLKVPPASAAILGAALASTDPVLLRGLLRRRDIPTDARQALQLESGLNDAVLLPIVVIAIAFTGHYDVNAGSLAKLGLGLFILGPGAGIAVGLIAVAALDLIRKRTGVRRDYESLYSLGVAFSAYAAAEAVHGSGFLAAFAAGLTIAALDVELCDCFIEYGGVTAEMLLLFTFVIFGSSLIWTGFSGLDWATVIFAVVAMLIRIPIYLVSLLRSRVNRRGRLLIAWFGPRGLSSLLLILLPVFAGLPGSERLFQVCALVVLMSVVIHGGSPMLLARFCKPKEKEDETPSPETQIAGVSSTAAVAATALGPATATSAASGTAASATSAATPTTTATPGTAASATSPTTPTTTATPGTAASATSPTTPTTTATPGTAVSATSPVTPTTTAAPEVGPNIVTLDDVARLQNTGQQVILLDVRTERSMETSESMAQGAVRMPPEHVVAQARELKLPKEAWLIAYCA